VQRENRCFDLGGYFEVFEADQTLATSYKRFMFINTSLRGPFFPPWVDNVCWSDKYWDKLDERTKIVGKCAADSAGKRDWLTVMDAQE
jgi:hypothetical protein